MSLSNLLEDFSLDSLLSVAASEEAVPDEAVGAEQYEAGYHAGWEDCLRAQAQEKQDFEASFRGQLLDLSFTYHEAAQAILAGLEPALAALFGRVLPQLARESLPGHITEQVMEMVEAASPASVLIEVAPQQHAALAQILSADLGFPIAVAGRTDIPPNNARIKVDDAERYVDLDGTLARISAAIDAFFHAYDHTNQMEASDAG